MSFAKPTTKQESSFDEAQRLICSHAGCNNRWSVMIDKPKCSKHQWSTPVENFPNIPVIRDFGNDGLAWARKIVKLHESGFHIRALSMKMACEALKIENPIKIATKQNTNSEFAKKIASNEYKPKSISTLVDDVF